MSEIPDEIAETAERVRFLVLAIQGFDECVALARLASRMLDSAEHPAVRGILVGMTACYGRIFKKSFGLGTLQGTDYEEFDTPELRRAHQFLLSLRDSRHMHLDADVAALSRELGEKVTAESRDPKEAFPVHVWLKEDGSLVLEPEMKDLDRARLPDVIELAMLQRQRVDEELQPLLGELVSVSAPLVRGVRYKLGESFPLQS
ncbi:hypothetical protein [Aquimonas voraii]|uniref:hypothetical protein n=1 Tax=Aquimonas voraii TaxID=265719 RepID=UPI00115FE7FA|nr:hypothetical protein [Aquimonas voraii]